MTETVPKHIGLILDGNRRWAKINGLPQLEGHRAGFENLKIIAEQAFERKVEFVTAFVFSTENWNRTKEEVGYLMDLAFRVITRDLKDSYEKGVKLVWVGSEEGVSDKLIRAIRNAEHETRDNTKGTLGVCFNYGGKKEITEAVRKIVREGTRAQDITEDVIRRYLYAPQLPDLDLLIRTGGEQRISNFMLWRAAYAELYFTEKHWPAFDEQDLDAAIAEYAARNRRFGG
jgi:undecaprenyl diphosphate synthase